MKKILILIFLSIFYTNSSFAEWMLGSATEGETFYYESSSIAKDGEITYVWALMDLKKIGEYGEMSNKLYLPIKCKLNQFQLVQVIRYPEKMGKGQLIERIENPDIKWIGAPPNSAWEGLIKRVCAR